MMLLITGLITVCVVQEITSVSFANVKTENLISLQRASHEVRSASLKARKLQPTIRLIPSKRSTEDRISGDSIGSTIIKILAYLTEGRLHSISGPQPGIDRADRNENIGRIRYYAVNPTEKITGAEKISVYDDVFHVQRKPFVDTSQERLASSITSTSKVSNGSTFKLIKAVPLAKFTMPKQQLEKSGPSSLHSDRELLRSIAQIHSSTVTNTMKPMTHSSQRIKPLMIPKFIHTKIRETATHISPPFNIVSQTSPLKHVPTHLFKPLADTSNLTKQLHLPSTINEVNSLISSTSVTRDSVATNIQSMERPITKNPRIPVFLQPPDSPTNAIAAITNNNVHKTLETNSVTATHRNIIPSERNINARTGKHFSQKDFPIIKQNAITTITKSELASNALSNFANIIFSPQSETPKNSLAFFNPASQNTKATKQGINIKSGTLTDIIPLNVKSSNKATKTETNLPENNQKFDSPSSSPNQQNSRQNIENNFIKNEKQNISQIPNRATQAQLQITTFKPPLLKFIPHNMASQLIKPQPQTTPLNEKVSTQHILTAVVRGLSNSNLANGIPLSTIDSSRPLNTTSIKFSSATGKQENLNKRLDSNHVHGQGVNQQSISTGISLPRHLSDFSTNGVSNPSMVNESQNKEIFKNSFNFNNLQDTATGIPLTPPIITEIADPNALHGTQRKPFFKIDYDDYDNKVFDVSKDILEEENKQFKGTGEHRLDASDELFNMGFRDSQESVFGPNDNSNEDISDNGSTVIITIPLQQSQSSLGHEARLPSNHILESGEFQSPNLFKDSNHILFKRE